MKLLFILSGNLSTTPRALKNILALRKKHDIYIVAINRSERWLRKDMDLLKLFSLNYYFLNLMRNNSFVWWYAGFLQKIAQKWYGKNASLQKTAFASEKASILLWLYLKKDRRKYDFIFAHSYGSIFPAYEHAGRLGIPFVVDIEDFYPGEKIAVDNPAEKERREFLLKKILPESKHFFYASPLIGLYTLNLLPQNTIPKHSLLNNSFPQHEFILKNTNYDKLRLVWFSQTIDKGRGLEFILPVLQEYSQNLHFTIFGYLNNVFYEDVLKKYSFVYIEDALPQKQLHRRLCEFDIGLALELKSTDLNKDLALSNKLFAYSQAGLYILATDTAAQTQWLNTQKNAGIICRQNDISHCRQQIEYIINNKETILQNKKQRFLNAKKLAWEHEIDKLKKVLKW